MECVTGFLGFPNTIFVHIEVKESFARHHKNFEGEKV